MIDREVIGTVIGLNLLFGIDPIIGLVITGFDTFLFLAIQRLGIVAVLAGVLLKHFADRQVKVGPGAIAYLVPRIERSFAAAAAIAARLDAEAFSAKRPITVRLVRAVLADYSSPPSDLTVT